VPLVAPGAFLAVQTFSAGPAASAPTSLEVSQGDWTRTLEPLQSPFGLKTWARLPNDAPLGQITAAVVQDGVRYTSQLQNRSAAPGLFTQSYSASGPARAINYGTTGVALNALTSAATPRIFVALFGTGLNGARANEVTVSVGGIEVEATFAGPQGIPGLDQVNFRIPPNAYLGCYVPVTLLVRGVVSNVATLAINSDSFACAHPMGLSYDDLRTLDQGRSIPLAILNLLYSKITTSPLRQSASLQLLDGNAQTVALFSGTQLSDQYRLTCRTPLSGGAAGVVGGISQNVPATLRLTGPEQQQLTLTTGRGTDVSGETAFFTPGAWRIRADASPTNFFLPFEYTFQLPPLVRSLNVAPGQALSTEVPLDLHWDPSRYADELVTFFTPGAACTTRASLGAVQMPKPIRPTPPTLEALGFVTAPHPEALSKFSIQARDGRLIRGIVRFSFEQAIDVQIR
jgi:hypothetical protein